jgi:hypothetical protein
MTRFGDPSGRPGIRLCPATLDEEGRADIVGGKGVEQAVGIARGRRPVGVLGIERQRDAEDHATEPSHGIDPAQRTEWRTAGRTATAPPQRDLSRRRSLVGGVPPHARPQPMASFPRP